LAPKKNPHEMGSEKGNVKIGRKIGRPQILEKIGSSGWTRTRLREGSGEAGQQPSG
jgi:hypothetical protein